ncbi:sigma factor-like helix-turn-helix DNA-binding protein [Streptomyces lusitanus]|uniref:Sigma factor-like helix-turn-helix DNA-binding protein n=1 Tax=Streptomyces lusitanus TaxID=68232 RepID=A0ABU3JP50_9ACTN|nr:sigma factor-like helix-turn-helix DNA-binding protein [Streptomyces lusitanus]
MTDRAKEVQRVLDAIDALAANEPPASRARQLTELLGEVQARVRQERKQAVREMHDSGLTYRQIAAELGISFGRVRQILAEDTEPTEGTADG